MNETALNCSYFLSPYLNEYTYYVLMVVMLFVVTYLVLKRYSTKLSLLGLIFIYFGGLQNVYQRIRYNCVVDEYGFFDLFFFNAADVLIMAGMLLILFTIIWPTESSS